MITDINNQPLSPEAERMLEYLRSRAESMGTAGIRERIRAAARELESAVAGVSEAQASLRPIKDKWTIAEVVDHIAQTQIRAAEELRHLFAGRRPPGPPVYEALRSGAARWAPWTELVDGLKSANEELIALLASAPESAHPPDAAAVRTVLVVSRALPDGRTAPQIFITDLDWREYALLQRLHLLDHRTQIKNLRAALAG
ncbi:MAG TPA: DinB family protein [Bryobacteraceae bacterium]|nr:DinB family protein [Bryobacteraceae bacterium]